MNKQTQEALKMAIEELNSITFSPNWDSIDRTINACKEALEQPAQEPVEVYGILDDGDYVSVEATKEGAIKQCDFMNKHGCNCTYKPLYTHPHQWQGLTDDVVASIWMHEAVPMNGQDFKRVYRAIEQALKEKNT